MSQNSLLKKALLEVKDLRSEVARWKAKANPAGDTIAIIGVGCRLPGGIRSPEELWSALSQGVDAVDTVPATRWPTCARDAVDIDSDRPLMAALVDDVAGFDPEFFGITPREAERMDPQQRMLLEVVWESIERSGQSIDALQESRTGVFIGCATSDFTQLQTKYLDPDDLGVHFITGCSPSFLAGRVSYTLGLHGPSMVVDTACSSSLTCVHLAMQSLRRRECSMALVGGVNLILLPETTVSLQKAKMLAPGGRCRTFDANADGYVRGEGCVVLAIKRLDDAVAANDEILAVIRGSAINHDGRSSGITVPNGKAQQAVIHDALRDADVEAKEVTYLEAHGTGTPLGDPIEVDAIGSVFAGARSRPLYLGSLKTNFGHLEGAAGILGLLKVALSVQKGQIPRHLHLQQINSGIDLSRVPVEIPKDTTMWPSDARRIAGISSFGASGTNAHVIVEAPPAPVPTVEAPSTESETFELLTLSARSEAELIEQCRNIGSYLANTSEPLARITHTLKDRRRFRYRAAFTAKDTSEASVQLDRFVGEGRPALRPAVSKYRQKTAFLFSGQGSQYPGMGAQLYKKEPIFRQSIDRSAEIVVKASGKDIRMALERFDGDDEALAQTDLAQPAIFALEYALAELLRHRGIIPDFVLGHSLGEYVAATVSGRLTLDSALTFVVKRGQLMQSLPSGGGMASVSLAVADVESELVDYPGLAVASDNGGAGVTVSGTLTDLERFRQCVHARQGRFKALSVSHAFHSPLMEPILAQLAALPLQSQTPSTPAVLISNVSGEQFDGRFDGSYVQDHARSPVQFARSIRTLLNAGVDAIVEIGPRPALLSLAKDCVSVDESQSIHWIPTLRAGREDDRQIWMCVGKLFEAGRSVNSDGGCGDVLRKAALPTYPFSRRRLWPRRFDEVKRASSSGRHGHGLLGRKISVSSGEILFESEFDLVRHAFLGDFELFGRAGLNIGVYLGLLLEAGRALSPSATMDIRRLVVH
ncbi:MAG: type I polyketide synthase, partial [Myxococcota bacterium]